MNEKYLNFKLDFHQIRNENNENKENNERQQKQRKHFTEVERRGYIASARTMQALMADYQYNTNKILKDGGGGVAP